MTNKKGSARKWLIGGVAAMTVTAGLVIGAANPAAADPTAVIVGVGSDTTQDVLNGLANAVGGGLVGSYDAVNPGDHITVHDSIAPKTGCTMTRPNGSGEGVNALRQSLGSTITALADPPEPGCVDFARSSSGPGTNASTSGQLVYIPVALDAVAVATGPATAVGGSDPAVATNIVDANSFTKAQIVSMYQTGATVTIGSTVYDPQHRAGNTPIDLYVPQSGSGTRNFWLTTVGLSTTAALPAWVSDTFDLNGTTTIVEEHDGKVFATDPNAFGPFSIAQFVAQTNGHNDRRHNVVLHSIDGVAPLTAGGTLNTAFPITREVYNVVSFARVTSTAAADQVFVSIFNSRPGMAPAAVCRQAAVIQGFGFAQLTGAPLGHTCGQVATDLRAFATL